MNRMVMTILLGMLPVCAAHAQLPVTEGLIVHLRADSITGPDDGDSMAVWVDSAQGDPADGTVADVESYPIRRSPP